MGKSRGYIPVADLLAAALRQLGDIPWEIARGMTAEEFLEYCAKGAPIWTISDISIRWAPKKRLLAAVLRHIGDISEEHANAMGDDRVIGLFARDHIIYKTWEESPGEFDKHWNLVWRFRREHIEKTKKDVGVIAKTRKTAKKHAEHKLAMEQKGSKEAFESTFDAACKRFGTRPRRQKIKSAGFTKGHRKMQSRNNLRRRSTT